MKKRKLLNWLKKNQDVLKISALEKGIDCPQTTIQKALKKTKELPNKWVDPLLEYLNKKLNIDLQFVK